MKLNLHSRQEYLLQNKTYEYDGFNKATKVTAEYYGTAAESTSAYHTATVEDFSYAAEQNSSIKVRVQENFYDAEHLRYGIVEDGERTNFITNGWNVLSESDAEFDVTKRLVLGYGIVSSNTLSDGEEDYQFFHWNEHGDTEYITGDDGNVLNRYEYDAFGSLTTAEEIIRNRYTYNGEQYDNITSQYYLRARFYNPLIARFTQEDVYRGDGLNLYAYCANNAVMYVDPSGYKCETGTEGESDPKKTYQTYTKTNPTTGEIYSGRTSGTGTPAENVAKRDANHHMNDKGFGPAELDKTSSNKNAIRGREQQLIEANGGAKSERGTSGNAINGIGPSNNKKDIYIKAAEKEFK